MPRSSLLAALVPIFVPALVLAGCGSDEGGAGVADGTGQEAAGATKILEAKLYDEPHKKVDAFCDSFTLVTVSKGRGGLVVQLENKLAATSQCEIFVAPNVRTFKATESSSCGSKIYEGSGDTGSVRVQDNATRLCEDLRPSLIEVTERASGAGARSLFGEPLKSAPGGGTTPKGCAFGNRTLRPGERVPDADGCNTCTCREDGSVACTELACQ